MLQCEARNWHVVKCCQKPVVGQTSLLEVDSVMKVTHTAVDEQSG